MFALVLVFNGRFVPAAWMIFFAVIFDGLDGKVARVLGGSTQFGLEYKCIRLARPGLSPSRSSSLKSYCLRS
jgi:hypothetical protein